MPLRWVASSKDSQLQRLWMSLVLLLEEMAEKKGMHFAVFHE